MSKKCQPSSPNRGHIKTLQDLSQDLSKCTTIVDGFLEEESGRLQFIWEKDPKKRSSNSMTCYPVLVDYDKPNAIVEAIEALKHSNELIGFAPEKIPLVGHGQVEQKVREVFVQDLDKSERRGWIYCHDVADALKRQGKKLGLEGNLKFADPLTAILFISAHPDKQKYSPMTTFFADNDGQHWRIKHFYFKSLDRIFLFIQKIYFDEDKLFFGTCCLTVVE